MRKVIAIAALGLAGSLGVTACGSGGQAPSPSPASSDGSVSDGSAYPASAQNSVVSDCEQNYGEPLSYCQCNLSWLQANIPYPTFTQAPATFEQQAEGYASC